MFVVIFVSIWFFVVVFFWFLVLVIIVLIFSFLVVIFVIWILNMHIGNPDIYSIMNLLALAPSSNRRGSGRAIAIICFFEHVNLQSFVVATEAGVVVHLSVHLFVCCLFGLGILLPRGNVSRQSLYVVLKLSNICLCLFDLIAIVFRRFSCSLLSNFIVFVKVCSGLIQDLFLFDLLSAEIRF